VELAQKFGVSRGPVREGLQILVQEGLLRREPHRGVFTPDMTDDDIADVYAAREAIEGSAMRLILREHPKRAERMPVLAPLQKIMQDMRTAAAAHRWSRVADLDMSFHREVVAAAGSPRLTRMYTSLIDETRILLNMTATFSGRDDLVPEHSRLLAGLESGNLEELMDELSHHFRDSIATIRKNRP
jgi:DNA-binding GntR family transcriptional regulator